MIFAGEKFRYIFKRFFIDLDQIFGADKLYLQLLRESLCQVFIGYIALGDKNLAESFAAVIDLLLQCRLNIFFRNYVFSN